MERALTKLGGHLVAEGCTLRDHDGLWLVGRARGKQDEAYAFGVQTFQPKALLYLLDSPLRWVGIQFLAQVSNKP